MCLSPRRMRSGSADCDGREVAVEIGCPCAQSSKVVIEGTNRLGAKVYIGCPVSYRFITICGSIIQGKGRPDGTVEGEKVTFGRGSGGADYRWVGNGKGRGVRYGTGSK